MAKLQMIKRADGSVVYNINIPLGLIEELGWEKGNILEVEVYNDGSKKQLRFNLEETEIKKEVENGTDK